MKSFVIWCLALVLSNIWLIATSVVVQVMKMNGIPEGTAVGFILVISVTSILTWVALTKTLKAVKPVA